MKTPIPRALICAIAMLPIAVLPARIGHAGPTPAARDTWGIPQLIDALADPDSKVRKDAAERLLQIGMPARPTLIRAARSDDPEQRAQAAQVLRRLPWWQANDPPHVRALLERYGDSSEGARRIIIERLGDLKAYSVLMRLLDEEPADALRWGIVVTMFDEHDPDAQRAMRELQPADDDAPALVLAGQARILSDKRTALKLLRQAVDADALRPGNDGGVLEVVAYKWLIPAAIETQQLDEAADLLRRHIPRQLQGRFFAAVPSRALLTALHEYFGPLRDFESDQRIWPQANQPQARTLTAAAAGLFARLGQAPPLPTGATGSLSANDRYIAARFLMELELLDAAELETRSALAAKKTPGQPELESNFLLLLAQVAGQREDDELAIACYERAIQLGRQNDFRIREDDPGHDALAQLAWRRARVAQKRGDTKTADARIAELLDLTPSNTDTTIDMVTWLKSTSRTDAAQKLFEKLYDIAKARVEKASYKAGARNDLAWLCARCGERIPEALELARAAVKETPDNAAFLDTLAEASYRAGKRDDAIKFEQRALELTPDMKFMHEQLARFQAGKP